jgi:hypothetical protein
VALKLIFATMNAENRCSLVTDAPVELERYPVEVQDLRKITDRFRGIYVIYLKSTHIKAKRCQHVTGWTWKHLDLDRLCSEIFLGGG